MALMEALAAGRDPDASAELTLVAHALIGSPERRRLAAGLDRVLRAAAERRPWGVPLNRREILTAREELAALAERLRDGGPVHVQGVARAALLARDGRSPIYDVQATQSVWRLARRARQELDGLPA
jgi:hypothetical protein